MARRSAPRRAYVAGYADLCAFISEPLLMKGFGVADCSNEKNAQAVWISSVATRTSSPSKRTSISSNLCSIRCSSRDVRSSSRAMSSVRPLQRSSDRKPYNFRFGNHHVLEHGAACDRHADCNCGVVTGAIGYGEGHHTAGRACRNREDHRTAGRCRR